MFVSMLQTGQEEGRIDGKHSCDRWVQMHLLLHLPELFSPPVAMDLLLYSDQQQFSRDVDEKANAYFQAIYNRGMSVDRLLDILKQFKDSANKKERVSEETSMCTVIVTGCKGRGDVYTMAAAVFVTTTLCTVCVYMPSPVHMFAKNTLVLYYY